MTLKTKSPLCNGLSTIFTIFPHQQEMKEKMDSSNLCLKASSSFLDKSMTILNENCCKNSWVKSSHVLRREDSKDANQHWAAPLRDNENKVIIYDSSSSWALITILYSLKWMWGQPMLAYLWISSILNLFSKLNTSAPSKSSQIVAPSEALIYLNLCSSLSIRACGSSEVRIGNATGGETTSVWLCKVKGIACGSDWLGGGGGGTVGSYCAPS